MKGLKDLGKTRFLRGTLIVIIAAFLGSGAYLAGMTARASYTSGHNTSSSCVLNSPGGQAKHVIYIQFDNVHLTRDNPNVPSDLEQMPNLLNFIKSNGTMLSNNHTPLISHTGTDILTSLTGVYGDRHGIPVANSYGYFKPDGTTGFASSFTYWTSPLYDSRATTPTDTTYNMLTAQGKNAPAPWVPYTRAGCNVGGVGTANIELENTGIDIPTVFGANSPEAAEAQANPNLAQTDFVGIAVHCAQGNAVCSSAHNSKPDILPDEPGGYNGYNGLFGHKYVAPQISPNGPLTDLNGNVIQDANGNPGFPGFDGMSAATSLAYVAAMQEHDIPVTYAYISDAHDSHTGGNAFGPGQAGYEAQLKAYNDAFGKFFTRLAKDGINSSNTLFVVTSDENDHFVGGAPTPANCDGVTVPCNYSQIGEIDGNLAGLLATEKGITTPFTVHSDSAPTVYITGNPARTAPVTRQFEQAAAGLTANNPITGKTDQLTNYMADPVEMKLLHMVTADPARTPTFTLFANPDYFLFAGAANCNSPCIAEEQGFAWNHGDVSPDINRTWLGLVGPGVQNLGLNNSIWADHTDIRPTMMALLGLKDDYTHDGRVLFETMTENALPPAVRDDRNYYTRLAQAYKQINAPVGSLGLATLQLSTTALASNTSNDDTYTNLENQIQQITTQRNTLASRIISVLEAAEFGGHNNHAASSSEDLTQQANALLGRVEHTQH